MVRRVGACGDERRFGCVGVDGFVAGVEAGADGDASGAEGHRPATVGGGGDTASSEYGHRGDGGDHGGEEGGESVVVAAVTAGLVALGDDDVGAGGDGAAGLVDGLDLAGDHRLGGVGRADVWHRVAERQPQPAHASVEDVFDDTGPASRAPT